METSLAPSIQIPLPHGLTMLCGAHAVAGPMLDLCAQIALTRTLRILDCGNRSDMYYVAKELRFLTRDPAAALMRICLSRAFTCYQTAALLENTLGLRETPIFVFDLLTTFLDESVSLREAERLMTLCLTHLRQMSLENPVLVGIRPLAASTEARAGLLEQARTAADQWVVKEEPGPPALPNVSDEIQLPLF